MADDLIDKFREEFQADYAVMEEQRDRSNEEFRFSMVPGGQWEGYLEAAYENRSKLEFDQVSDYLWRTYSRWTENRIIPEYSPDDDDSTQDDADVLNGLIRRDLRRRNGFVAIDTAVFEAIACGPGAFHMATEYDDEEDPDNTDQNVCFKEITNAYSMVVWDSGARAANKSDAMRCTLLVPYTRKAFEEKFPDVDADTSIAPDDRRWFNWSSSDLIYVAVRYHIEVKSELVFTWANPVSEETIQLTEKELEESKKELELYGFEEIGKKRIKRRMVYKSKFLGSQIIEKPRRIAGKYIPIIPIYAFRAFIDGVEFYHGVIRKRMDAQRVSNMSLSLATESAAHSHEDKMIFAPEQVEAHKNIWAKDPHQVPYLLADPILDESTGGIAHVGPVGVKAGSTLSQTAAALMQFAADFIRNGTGGAPQDTLDTDASGKAINAIIKRVDMNTNPIFDNIKQSLIHAGEVYRQIAGEIYSDRPGRVVKLLNKRDEPMPTKLVDSRAKNGAIVRYNDPSKGRFQVVVNTGPSYETRDEETLIALKDIYVAMDPQDPKRQMVLAMIIKLLPTGGLDDLKEYVHKELLAAGVVKPESEEDKAYMQQLEQQKANAGPSPQDQFVMAAAQKEQTQAAKNQKEIEQINYKNAETAANTRLKQVEADLKLALGA